MPRHLLALVFTATAVFGPPPCCCAGVKASGTRPTRSDHVPAKPAPRPCCTPQEPEKDSSPSGSPHTPGECPCKKSLPDADAARVDVAPQLAGEWVSATPLPWPSPSHVAHLSTGRPARLRHTARDGPAMTTDDLLYAHHRLRC